jgi:hypothetical protein
MVPKSEDKKRNWVNPFSADRVEDWRVEEYPENYKKIATLFAQPDFMNKLEDSSITKAIFLIGGRGCGKSHILKRMSIQSEIKGIEDKYNHRPRIKDYDKQYFGVYIKTDCFSPLSRENINYLNDNQRDALFEHLFNIEVTKTLIDAVKFASSNFEDCDTENELSVCQKVGALLNNGAIYSYSELLKILDDKVDEVINITKKILFDLHMENLNRISFTQAPDFILKISRILKSEFTFLTDKPLILMLDEYEALDINQQKLINQIIKGRRLILRIAVKTRGVKTLSTRTTEKIEEIHDYDVINLHFGIDTNFNKYKIFARTIFENRLKLKSEYGEYKEINPEKLLPPPTLRDEDIAPKEIDEELMKIRGSVRKSETIKDPEKYWKNLKGHYKEAAVYRILRSKGKDKLYAGFREYVSLSSGIIRLFIWLCREAFSIAYHKSVDIMNGKPIDVHLQTKGALNVSKNELTITIPQTVNNLYASKLAYLINDIGQILRAKLYFSTQPQANRIEIIDPEKFDSAEYEIPRELLESGHDLPVFLVESSFKPRDVKYPFPKTFALNRIFAPLLNIPPEGRWRTEIKAEELKGLCLSEHRGITLERIVNQIKGKKRIIRRGIKGKKGKSKDMDTLGFFEDIPKPITLENCPVTGKGCNRNLIDYEITEGSVIHSFLAIPFNEGWVSDPRTWIKNAMMDCCNVVCKDTDDFPNLGYLLCKICSCVRQYPFGLFEITEMNPNVLFELGMATSLNKRTFLVAYKEKIPASKSDFPPEPLNGIEYIPYELSRSSILSKFIGKIKPVIDTHSKSADMKCRIIDSECPHKGSIVARSNIFICLPEINKDFFDEAYRIIKTTLKFYGYQLNRYNPAKGLSKLCQICNGVRTSSFCLIDTSYNDVAMLFALGVAFGRDKQFIQLHNTELGSNRPISDLKRWAIEYKNLQEFENLLKDEVSKRLKDL